MQIIALSGRANEGKTTTVRKLIDILVSESSKRNYSISQRKCSNICVVEISELQLTIALGADGDTEYQVQENCSAAAESKADIFIQTTRTKGKGVDELFYFAQGKYDIIQIGTISKYFGLKSQFFSNEAAIKRINEIQTQNVWNLLLRILQENYNF